MALQASGAISLANIQTEFGGSNPISISEYYGAAAGVPSSGVITIGDFYGTSSLFTFTISTNQADANLRTLAVNAGWDQSTAVQATINSGVYCSASSTGGQGLTINGSFPAGVTLVNNGTIVGRGGNGGRGTNGLNPQGYAGAAGGKALTVSVAVTIQNNGTIAGGGGGGGGAAYDSSYNSPFNYTGGGGGGGGGRTSNGYNSAGGPGASGGYSGGPVVAGSPGGAGTVSAQGGGGAGGYGGYPGSTGGTGGSGGAWGAGGAKGQTISSIQGYNGGAAGACLTGNANITWTATGTRLGAIS